MRKRKLHHRYGRSGGSHSELDHLLSSAERTVDNVGAWRGEYDGARVWIGDPSGSRVRQYEARVDKDARGTEFRSRTFGGLKRQLLKHFGGGAA